MNLFKLATATIFAVGCLACGSGPEGTYTFDKAGAKKAMEEEIAKKPKEEQDLAKFALAFIDMMNITLEVKSGGKYEMKMSMGEGAEKKEEAESGDWTFADGTVTFKGKKDLKCKVEGSSLACEADKDGPPMVFKKS